MSTGLRHLTWQEKLARLLYTGLMYAARFALPFKLRARARREPGYLLHASQRWGRYDGPDRKGALWIHAVSLGETRAAEILVQRLRALMPDVRILLTHGTATGRAEGARWLRDGDLQAWLPWDTPGAVKRFLNHFQPAVGVLMETEVWPNLVEACQRHQLPLLLMNARLNEQSLQRSRKLAWLSRPAYAGLAAVYAQTDADARRLSDLGAQVAGVFGNLKFDIPVRPDPWSQGRSLRAALGNCSVAMLASSRDGEEALWLQAWKRLRDRPPSGANSGRPRQVWLVVPRHPQRFDAVAELLSGAGLKVFRRRQLGPWDASVPLPAAALTADVWLGDSLGELPLYYGMSDAALLGGSFLPLGGQNLIEAAACDCPVIMGPSTFNFSEAAEWALAEGAAVRVADMDAAVCQAQAWSQAAPATLDAIRGCEALMKRGAGSADRYAMEVMIWLKAPKAHSPP